jgi:tetratricopeptide (TPR) repeat protein
MCEAAEGSNDQKLIKAAAEASVAAAEAAVMLNPKSSEAHQLLADSLGLLIPNIFGGGMRYGKRSAEAADKAIELDPNNSNAYVTRSISYLYSPVEFGGSKQKGFELLQKAVEADPLADTPHIWLAQFYLEAGKLDDAKREIDEARRLNPERRFTQYVYDQVSTARKAARKQ